MLAGLKGTLALPRLHLHPSLLGFLQGEGGELLEDDREDERGVRRAAPRYHMNDVNHAEYSFIHSCLERKKKIQFELSMLSALNVTIMDCNLLLLC